MATTKFYLDSRAIKGNQPAPLKIAITKDKHTSLFNLNIRIKKEQWNNKAERIVAHPNKSTLNTIIVRKKSDIDIQILKLSEDGILSSMSAKDIKDYMIHYFNPEKDDRNESLFAYRFRQFANSKTKSTTRELYEYTIKLMKRFDAKYETLRFEDVNKDWLTAFDNWMMQCSPKKNARNIHLRNIRAVFNDAIDNNVTTSYPFRKFKIRAEQTAKRSLTTDELREFMECRCEDFQQKYKDMFMLMFYLIGINSVDLFQLKQTDFVKGRIIYHRSKTGRLYDIKVEPEALAIINKYRGKNYLLDICDRYHNYKDFVHRMNENLREIGSGMFPELTAYWSRHSWATIAYSIGVPKDTISQALGHSFGNRTTDTYIDYDNSKVDEANRKVIDYVNADMTAGE